MNGRKGNPKMKEGGLGEKFVSLVKSELRAKLRKAFLPQNKDEKNNL